MTLGLEGKIAIVTGASKGIGKAIAYELAAEGVHLALSGRDRNDLEQCATDIRAQHQVQVLPVVADLATLAGVETLVKTVHQHFGRIDILINNAGSIRSGSLLSKPDDDWQEDWNLKLFGYLRMMREVFQLMQAGGGGRIVNIIGRAGRQADPDYLAGGGANAALMNMTKGVAVEGGPHNICVNAINPGPTRTERYDSINANLAKIWGISVAEVENRRMQDIPLGRPCEPEEVAALAVFLVSSRATYINGVIMELDGGATRCI